MTLYDFEKLPNTVICTMTPKYPGDVHIHVYLVITEFAHLFIQQLETNMFQSQFTK